MDARTTPFTHMRFARAYRAERDMLAALEQHEERGERMLDRLLRVLGGDPDSVASRPAQPVA